MTAPLSDALRTYLEKWHATTVRKKTEAGHEVRLSFDEFVALFKPSHLASLDRAMAANRLNYFQNEKNQFALVASWRSYAACSSGVYDSSTAIICSRNLSKQLSLPKPGDKLRLSHRANVSKAKMGVPQTQEHREAISAALKNQPKQPWTDERKAARRAQIAQKKEK